MVRFLPCLDSNTRTQHRRVALPLVPALVDNERYYLPGALPPTGRNGLLALSRPDAPLKPRGPTLRTQVKLALEFEIAEKRGTAIRRRLDCLDPTQRRERARVLVASGMSQSDTARILRVGKATISRDLAEKV
jgi:hypothetical protein